MSTRSIRFAFLGLLVLLGLGVAAVGAPPSADSSSLPAATTSAPTEPTTCATEASAEVFGAARGGQTERLSCRPGCTCCEYVNPIGCIRCACPGQACRSAQM